VPDRPAERAERVDCILNLRGLVACSGEISDVII
jgi:hypothetical protein